VSARLLDGRALAGRIRTRVAVEADTFRRQTGRSPALRVFLIGDDPASDVYVRNKLKASAECGIAGETVRLPAETTSAEILGRLATANGDGAVDGILVQLPLPPHVESRAVLDAIDPLRDVDAFHPENVGLLHQGRPRFVPCTPGGILELLDAEGIEIAGRRAVVVGRSEIVGKPMAALLLARNATVTTAHSKTRDLPDVCREADILVAAIGRARFVGAAHLNPGVAVIDVGMNRVVGKLCGDVDEEAADRIAAARTPVPGGVGPLTIAMLMSNTVRAARLRCFGSA